MTNPIAGSGIMNPYARDFTGKGVANPDNRDVTESGTTNPQAQNYYTPGANDKNTLTITDYFQLLAAQLQYQDMSNPMDNSEMMAQMTQMAMVQALTTMNSAMETSTVVTTSTYAAGLVGQEVTVAVTEKAGGILKPVGVKYGVVESVNFTDYTPMIRLKDDDTDYPLAFVLGMGKIEDPYNKPEDEEGENGGVDGGGAGGSDGPGGDSGLA